jgi:lysophospholipase L1-like esterase
LRTTHLFGARPCWTRPDPVLHYRFVPGAKYWSKKENDHPITGRINRYGWRDKEWQLHKRPDEYRIAVLGDSFVEGYEVELDSTFHKLTERNWNRGGICKIELMNFGRSDFTQTEELLVLKSDVRQFSPDMVIVFFYPGNDIDEVRRATSSSFNRPFYTSKTGGELVLDTSFSKTAEFKVRSIVNKLQRRSALISLIAERYVAFKESRSENVHRSKIEGGNKQDGIHGYLSLCTQNPNASYLQSYSLNKRLIGIMAEFCKENGFHFMLVCQDIPTYIPEKEKKLISVNSTFYTNFFEDDLKHQAKLLNVEYLGLQRVFRRVHQTEGVELHWFHWNYRGHRVVAEALSSKLHTLISNTSHCQDKRP